MGASVVKKPPSTMEQSPQYIKEKVKWGDLLSSTVDRVMMQPHNLPSWASPSASASSINSFGVSSEQQRWKQNCRQSPWRQPKTDTNDYLSLNHGTVIV